MTEFNTISHRSESTLPLFRNNTPVPLFLFRWAFNSVSAANLACTEWTFQGYALAQLPVLEHFNEKSRVYPVKTAKPLYSL